MPSKLEGGGCTAKSVGFAALLGDPRLGASCNNGFVEELDADMSSKFAIYLSQAIYGDADRKQHAMSACGSQKPTGANPHLGQ